MQREGAILASVCECELFTLLFDPATRRSDAAWRRRLLQAHRHLRLAAAHEVLAAPERPPALARGALDELDAAARARRPPPLAFEGDAQQRFLLLRVTRRDEAQQAVDVVQADAVAVRELACVGAE